MNPPRLRTFLSCVYAVAILAGLLLAASAVAQEQKPRPAVVLISIDGLKPEYVLDADAHGLKIPNLRRFLDSQGELEGEMGP